MDDIIPTDGSPSNEIDIFSNGSNIFDVQRFEMVSKFAEIMARASLIPDHLKVKGADGSLDYAATFANCFIIANLALTWGFDPFMVAQSASLTYGKITLEGKLVRSVIRKYLKFDFFYLFFGDAGDMSRRVYISDKPLLDNNGNPMDEAGVEALARRGERITIGTLQKWHTKNKSGGINDNWAKDEDKMFRERGAREWCRQWAPGLILGIYTPDEFDEESEEYRARRAKPINQPAQTAANPLLDDKSRQRHSVPMDRIDAETGEILDAKPDTKPQQKTAQKQAPAAQREEQKPAQRLSAQTFREYGRALVRVVNADNLLPTHDGFWKDKAPQSGPDYDLARGIYSIHSERLKNGGDPQKAIEAVTKLIDKDFPL